MAKVWLAYEVASPSAKVTLKDLNIVKDLKAHPELANYKEHFVKPMNQCFKVMSAGEHARDSLYRRKPQQARTEDIPAWQRRLVAVANEAFGPVSKWSREHRGIMTDCFISRSRYPEKLKMYVNKSKLEAAGAGTRADHLEELSRLCGEASVNDQAMHQLDDYHLMPDDPAVMVTPAASTAADAGSEQKSKPWNKKSQRRYADRQGKPTEQVLWTKKDGKCSTCNQDDCPESCLSDSLGGETRLGGGSLQHIDHYWVNVHGFWIRQASWRVGGIIGGGVDVVVVGHRYRR